MVASEKVLVVEEEVDICRSSVPAFLGRGGVVPLETVAEAPHGLDVVGGRPELGAQTSHVHVHGASPHVAASPPHAFEELWSRLRLATAPEERLE